MKNTKIFSENGDWAHYDFGVHGIPGVGNLEGSDDVYSQTLGNFLQCFCPVDNSYGTQTNWWNVQRAGLTQEQISQFQSQGWILIDTGAGWNLFDEKYLVRNSSFSCSQPLPSLIPSPSPMPSLTPTLTPTPSPMPSLTPTPITTSSTAPGPAGPPAVCIGADLGGYAPTVTEVRRVDSDTVHACWTASTPNANDYIVYYGMSRDNLPWNTKVVDSQCVDIHNVPQGHVWLKVAATDNCVVGNFSSTVEQTPQVLSATTPEELPSTGISVQIVGLILILSGVGYYLYRRFKLI